jgi:Cys-rich protein (TIGR01571 family)
MYTATAPPVEENRLIPKQSWKTGILDCFDYPMSTLDVLCCYPCQLSRQYNFLKHGNRDLSIECCVVLMCCGVYCPQLPIGPLLLMKMRDNIHSRYGIETNNYEHDIFVTMICSECVACQHYRELTLRGDSPGGFFVGLSSTMM